MDYKPGIYSGVASRDYHNAPAVNAGLLQTMVDKCPAAAWYSSFLNPERPREESSATMDKGTVAHAVLLEGGSSRIEIVDPRDFPAEKTGNIPDGWTNKAIRAERDRILAAGNIAMFKAQYDDIESMVVAARAFIASLEHTEPAIFAAFQPEGGDSELSLYWDDDGVLCRARPDRINTKRTLVVDYKTGDGSAEPNQWGRTQMVRLGYYMAAAFYRHGVQVLCDTRPEYVFLVQEREPPYLCSLVGVDEIGFDLGNSKGEYALNLWRKCVASGKWPAYPPRVCYPEIPVWERAQWEERESLGIEYDPAKLWQPPHELERAP